MSKSYTEEVLGEKICIDKWDEAVLNVAEFVLKKKKLVLSLIKTAGHHYITGFLVNYIKPYIKDLVRNLPEGKDIDEKGSEFISNFYTISLSGVIIEYLAAGLYETTPPTELAHMLKIVLEGSIESALKRYKNAFNN